MRLASTRGAGASTARSDHEVLDVTECSGSCPGVREGRPPPGPAASQSGKGPTNTRGDRSG
jgi:hypothetical protein